MASVNVSFDTVTKSLSVSIDGQEVPDIEEVMFHTNYGYSRCCGPSEEHEYSMVLRTVTDDEENSMRKGTFVSAQQMEKGDTEVLEGIYAKQTENVKADIKRYFE